jgi:iron complex transport system permease protein
LGLLLELAPLKHTNRYIATLIIGLILLIITFLADLSIGSADIALSDILSILMGKTGVSEVQSNIIWTLRLPKALTALLAGAGLSLAGLLTQTLFRNPLAGPDVLGLSMGASLAVALVLLAGLGIGIWSIAAASAVGAAGVFALVMAVSRKIASHSSLLVVGLMIGALASSVIGILQYLSRADDLQLYTIWTMGNLTSANYRELLILALFIIGAALVSFSSVKSLNAWALGERYFQSIGLRVMATRWKTLLATCLITGCITAFCGPISFVGIAVPHFVKRVFPTNNHQQLIPLTLIIGAFFLLFCDILTSLPSREIILPINAATALFGAPVIIWIIIRSKKEFY